MTVPEEEVALKLLHTADWHLGMRFSSFDDADELKLTRSRLEVVDRLLGIAEHYTVDGVLCAGDLFDGPAPERQWWEGLVHCFQKRNWGSRPVFLLPGNHDPLTGSSVYAAEHPFRQALPSWVHVVDRDDFEYEFNSHAVLCARPCRSQAGEQDLALALPSRASGDKRIRVGLVHGQTFDINGCQTNFPIAEDAAERQGFDYLAIGDTHSFREVPPDARIPTVYPSAPEQTKFGEEDAGYVAIVFFPRRRSRPHIRRETVGKWTWREENVTDVESLARLRDEDLNQSVVRLHLNMSLSLAEYDQVREILRELKGTTAAHGRVGVLQVDEDNLTLDIARAEELRAELPNVLASVVDRLQEAEKTNPELAQRALYHLYQLARRS